MCSELLCHVCSLIILSSWLFFYGFYFVDWSRFYFLVFLLIFNYSVAIFLLLPSDKICSQVHILRSYCICGAQ